MLPVSLFTARFFQTYHIRAKGVGITIVALSLTDLAYLQASATAFANIGWKYFLLFIVITSIGGRGPLVPNHHDGRISHAAGKGAHTRWTMKATPAGRPSLCIGHHTAIRRGDEPQILSLSQRGYDKLTQHVKKHVMTCFLSSSLFSPRPHLPHLVPSSSTTTTHAIIAASEDTSRTAAAKAKDMMRANTFHDTNGSHARPGTGRNQGVSGSKPRKDRKWKKGGDFKGKGKRRERDDFV
ncbi:hypothetical protein K438DRAFT_1957455 [Mycena galopus ATCC 62051]|nr:hypothetical protein K438DRAFT_1957455 [Mycena galopus ATCC 62051]